MTVAICICTCQRNEGLRKLLASLSQQRFDEVRDHVVAIVIDNSPAAEARAVLEQVRGDFPFAISYQHEPRRGLSFARNRALDAARTVGARCVAFIDDDEMAPPTWLSALVAALDTSSASACFGPVTPIFARQPPRHLPVAAYALTRKSGASTLDGSTGNAIVSMDAINHSALRFDERFNASGGEDTVFFEALRRHGGDIAWAGDAGVFETVPDGRASPAWLWRRWMRTGATAAHLTGLDPDSGVGRLYSAARGLLRITAGVPLILSAALLYGWSRPDRVVSSGFTLCRGVGLLAAALGISPEPYAPPRPAPIAHRG